MQPKKTRGTSQVNLFFSDIKPMVLPEGKQRELAVALADLLLNAVFEPCATDRRALRGPCAGNRCARGESATCRTPPDACRCGARGRSLDARGSRDRGAGGRRAPCARSRCARGRRRFSAKCGRSRNTPVCRNVPAARCALPSPHRATVQLPRVRHHHERRGEWVSHGLKYGGVRRWGSGKLIYISGPFDLPRAPTYPLSCFGVSG
jgi:hypothetical protein